MPEKINKQELILDIKQAIDEQKGFALGKMGFSEQFLLGYLPFLRSNPSTIKIRAYESALRYHCEYQFGVFPTDPEFLKHFATIFSDATRSMDILGLFEVEQENELIIQNNLKAKFIPYQDTEPDRSIPESSTNCYLPLFANKKLLYISPFANLLKERSQKEIFENVWDNIKKKWFYPKSISTIEIPYSYGNSRSTHLSYGTSINLYESICTEIDKQDFDVVLMGVGALGFPLASYIKSKKKIALSLGGHLQVLFGIAGSRWKRDSFWNTHYINYSWIDMPNKYHPENKEVLTDNGSYW